MKRSDMALAALCAVTALLIAATFVAQVVIYLIDVFT